MGTRSTDGFRRLWRLAASSSHLTIPVLTFVLGLIASQLVSQLFDDYRIDTAAILALTVAIAVLTIAGRTTLENTTVAVERLASVAATSKELVVEYIDDGPDGASYRRGAEILRGARKSVVFVDYWEPFDRYQSHLSASQVPNSRDDFYGALDRSLFPDESGLGISYRRILQLPPALWESDHIPFSVDPPFARHLTRAIEVSNSHPDLVEMRVAPVLVRMTFQIVDDRHIIIPTLGYVAGEQRMRRYGAILIDDREGTFCAHLNEVVATLYGRSERLSAEEVA